VETLIARCAGLDVHKDAVTACVRVPGDDGGMSEPDAHVLGDHRRGWCCWPSGWAASG
jgi:hypothetical protein